jgi:hypothetical protein
MDGRRIDISATQVIASVLAALTGAIAASFLGVAGTIIGTALMSVASTAVAGIYKHYLARSRERLQAAAEAARLTPLVGGGAVAAFRGRQHTSDHPQGHDDQRTVTSTYTPAEPAPGQHRAAGPDFEPTEVLPAVGGPAAPGFATRPWDEADSSAHAPGAAPAADGRQASPAHRVTDANGPTSAREPAPADGAARADGTASGGGGGGGGAHARQDPGRRRRILVLAGLALGVFVLVMAGVTVFEVVAGKPLDAVVTGKSGSGTTISSIVGGNSSHHTKPASPAVTPHATPSPGASTAPSPTPSPSPSPSEGPAGPSPSGGVASPDTVPSSQAPSGTTSGTTSGAAPGSTPAPGRSP